MDCQPFKPSSELIHIFYNQYIFCGPNGVDVPLYIVLYLVFIMLIITQCMLVELGTDRHIDFKDGTLAL